MIILRAWIKFYLLQTVDTAELIQFMVHFVEDEGFVIVGSEVFHNVVY